MDIWDKKKRSQVMSKIRSKNTKPEMIIRKALFARGLRYRVNCKKLPGKPDIVFSKYKTVLFVHGCFWHGHEDCRDSHLPKTNVEFWKNKIGNNITRDAKNIQELLQIGWKVLIIWECQLKKSNIELLVDDIINDLNEMNEKEYICRLYQKEDDNLVMVAEEKIKYNRRNLFL